LVMVLAGVASTEDKIQTSISGSRWPAGMV